MKKLTLFLFLSLLIPNTWQNINSGDPTPMNIELISSDINSTTLKFTMDGFHLIKSDETSFDSYSVKGENGASILMEGAPDLHNFSTSIIVPDQSKMSVNIISYKYHDYENINIIPSKGNLTRDINPDDIPLVYSEVYEKDDFFPSNISELGNPYILRDLRGQSLSFNPFQYNPVTKTLRVYSEIIIETLSDGYSENNSITRVSDSITLSSNYDENRHFFLGHFFNPSYRKIFSII